MHSLNLSSSAHQKATPDFEMTNPTPPPKPEAWAREGREASETGGLRQSSWTVVRGEGSGVKLGVRIYVLVSGFVVSCLGFRVYVSVSYGFMFRFHSCLGLRVYVDNPLATCVRGGEFVRIPGRMPGACMLYFQVTCNPSRAVTFPTELPTHRVRG